MSVPAQCTKCGAIFWSRHFDFAMSSGILLSNNREPCAMTGCNGIARLAQGLFDFAPAGIEILSAPDVTREMLAVLRRTLSEKSESYTSIEELTSDIAAIHPSFRELVTAALRRPDVVIPASVTVAVEVIRALVGLVQGDPVRLQNNFYGPVTIIEQPLRPSRDHERQAHPFPPVPKPKPALDLIAAEAKAAVQHWLARPKPKPQTE